MLSKRGMVILDPYFYLMNKIIFKDPNIKHFTETWANLERYPYIFIIHYNSNDNTIFAIKLALIIGDLHIPMRAVDIPDKFKDLLVWIIIFVRLFIWNVYFRYQTKLTMLSVLEISETAKILTGWKDYQTILLW